MEVASAAEPAVSDDVIRAQLAERVERYDEMAAVMRALVRCSERQLSVLERNLLAIAYKNVSGERRAAYRSLLRVERDAIKAQQLARDSVDTVGLRRHERTARLVNAPS
jgi:hypothetical protein